MKYKAELRNALLGLCWITTLLLTGIVAAAQDRKLSRSDQEALEMRRLRDKAYAERKRTTFNRSSWIGSKLSDLIAAWGPPARMITDGGEGQIAVYEKSGSYAGGSYTPGYITTATNGYGQTVVVDQKDAVDTRYTAHYFESTAVYVDKNKIIQKVTYNIDRN